MQMTTTDASQAQMPSDTTRVRGAPLVVGASEVRDYLPFLRWLLLICLIVAGLVVLARLGLIQLMLETDRSRVSLIVLVIFGLTTVHCLFQTIAVSRELAAVRRMRETILKSATAFTIVGDSVRTAEGDVLEPSVLTGHIANLIMKSQAQGGTRLDQTLLLRALAEQLRGREKLGWFVAEALLRLALLGTAVGFILMLVPIAGLSSFDVESLRGALTGMTGGMAIALNVTVAGIASALLLKTEYYLLNDAVGDLFNQITELTEVHVVSALERR